MYIQVRDEGLGVYNTGFSTGGLPSAQEATGAGAGSNAIATIVKRGLILLLIAAVAFALYKYFNKKKRRRNRR